MSKTRIIDLLGEKALLLPELLNQAIVANERAKYLLGLLQIAAGHADAPDSEATTLRSERQACGIAESWLDHVAARSEALGAGVYHIPKRTGGCRHRGRNYPGRRRTQADCRCRSPRVKPPWSWRSPASSVVLLRSGERD